MFSITLLLNTNKGIPSLQYRYGGTADSISLKIPRGQQGSSYGEDSTNIQSSEGKKADFWLSFTKKELASSVHSELILSDIVPVLQFM